MQHKGIEYEIAMIEPGIWKWQFRIGAMIKSGKTKASLELLADRRVRITINRELRQLHAAVQRPKRRRSEVAEYRLTSAQRLALQATARGEVYRTHTGSAFTLVGPCSSLSLWALVRAELIADPPDAKEHSRYQMVLTDKGQAALALMTDAASLR